MKKQFSLIAATAALFLTVTPFVNAGTPSKAKKHAVKTTQTAAVKYTAVRAPQVQSENYGAEIGSDAPHQERNPSAHPELFQIAR